MRKKISILISILGIAVAGIYFIWFKNLNNSSELIIKNGASISSVSKELGSLTGSFNGKIFYFSTRIASNITNKQIKTGYYSLNVSLARLIFDTLTGNSIKDKITFIEGSRLSEVLEALKNHQSIAKTGLDQQTALKILKKSYPHLTSPEGMILADTYVFSKGTTDVEILKIGFGSLVEFLTKNQSPKQKILKNPYEILILSSIIEKETGVPDERPVIASVFLNRMSINMKLQTDPTVIYGLIDKGNYDGKLSRKHLQDSSNKYNTYKIYGLPPTPISIVGKEAILSVLNPAISEYFYFVAKGNGEHIFSKTYQEHLNYVEKYQKQMVDGYTSTYKKK